jgi:hypothetical protein
MERPFRSVAPRRSRWNARQCRWTMRIVCLHGVRSSRSVDNLEKFLSQYVAAWNPARAPRLVTAHPGRPNSEVPFWIALSARCSAGFWLGCRVCPLRPESDLYKSRCDPPLRAKRRHSHCSRFSYSITSSARARKVGGTSIPSERAVCRFRVNSNLVDCKTGKLAGLVPLRMLPV